MAAISLAKALPEGGSVFTVELPIGIGAWLRDRLGADFRCHYSPGVRRIFSNITCQGRAILVLDDEESIRMLLEEGLSA